ncbi:MAG: zinc-binding dehydrogenase, partial [Pyrinomonadaceae bacterium]|nr:zinc-binding dehydrogenase [Phycisphaerales bacterium]
RSTPEWDAEALKLTDGQGVDLVLETGGADTFQRSLQAAAFAGTIFVIGLLGGLKPVIDVLPIIGKALRVQGNNTGPVEDLADAAAAVAAHRIIPVVDRRFQIEDVKEAYALLAAGGLHFGKLAFELPG